MLQSLLESLKTRAQDNQIWNCDPLVITVGDGEIAYGQHTEVEYTPFESKVCNGHAITINPDPEGFRPEIAITSYTRITSVTGLRAAPRPGYILSGTDQFGDPVIWYTNAAANQFLTMPTSEPIPFDEETEAILRAEIKTPFKRKGL
jgi:hypothetical protein